MILFYVKTSFITSYSTINSSMNFRNSHSLCSWSERWGCLIALPRKLLMLLKTFNLLFGKAKWNILFWSRLTTKKKKTVLLRWLEAPTETIAESKWWKGKNFDSDWIKKKWKRTKIDTKALVRPKVNPSFSFSFHENIFNKIFNSYHFSIEKYCFRMSFF